MGMAASQARLLSITARLSNNEQTSESVAYSKQRLADQTHQITNEYNEALDATKLTVLTGFNGSVANYEDISYNLMTGMQMAENTKQYVVTDTKGRVLVTENIANAYTKAKGNYNQFLANLGYSQADINVQYDGNGTSDDQRAVQVQIHEAWDKYFASVGINKFMPEHDFGFSFTETFATNSNGKYYKIENGREVELTVPEGHNDPTRWLKEQNAVTLIGDGYAGSIRPLTENGNIKYKQAVDEDGQLVYSKFDYYSEETTIQQEIITGYEQAVDSEGHKLYGDLCRQFGESTNKEVAYTAQTDSDGNVLFTSEENKDLKPYYVFRDYDEDDTPIYDVYKAQSDTNDYTNGDSTHYVVHSFLDDNDKIKYIPQFTNQKVADISKPIEDHSKPIKNTVDITVYKNSKRYDTTSEPVYDYSQPIFVDSDGNYFYYDDDTDGDGIYDWFTADTLNNKAVYDPINYEGTTQESRDLYDYAMAITEAYLRVNINGASQSGTAFTTEYDMDAFDSAANSENKNAIKYYKNLYNKMQSSGFFTYTDTVEKSITDKEHYIYSEEGRGTSKVAKNPLKDNYTFEAALRDGSLRLQYFSSTKKSFVTTTISEDNCIQEVRDERAIAKAETKYNQDMADLENKDKKYDLELKKLDTEHKALETEYEAVKNVVVKNVESTFKVFS